MINAHFLRKITLAVFAVLDLSNHPLRLWWNWQTRNLEVVVLSGVQVQVLLTAPFIFLKDETFSLSAFSCVHAAYIAPAFRVYTELPHSLGISWF
jgi:hypothetical protein